MIGSALLLFAMAGTVQVNDPLPFYGVDIADRSRRWRYDEHPVPEKGITLTIRRLKPEEAPTQYCNYEYRITNDSDHLIRVIHKDFWTGHWLSLRSEEGARPPLTKLGNTLRGIFEDPHHGSDHNFATDLPPGRSLITSARWRLEDIYVLKPGRYRLTLEYYERDFYPLAVTSNALPIQSPQDTFLKRLPSDPL